MQIKFFGHAGVKIEDDLILLIDPWLNDNPLATVKAEDITKADPSHTKWLTMQRAIDYPL